MNYKWHLIPGIMLAILFLLFFHTKMIYNPFNIIALILITLISPLLPDIDHESSEIEQVFMASGLIIASAGVILYFLKTTYYVLPAVGGLALTAATFFTGQIAHHRGLIHTIQFCALWGITVFLITKFNIWLGLLAFILCWSHLWFDRIPFKITKEGGEPYEHRG